MESTIECKPQPYDENSKGKEKYFLKTLGSPYVRK